LVEINARKRDQKLAENEAALQEMTSVLEQGLEASLYKSLARVGPSPSTRKTMLWIQSELFQIQLYLMFWIWKPPLQQRAVKRI
jgi:hypothetical protein